MTTDNKGLDILMPKQGAGSQTENREHIRRQAGTGTQPTRRPASTGTGAQPTRRPAGAGRRPQQVQRQTAQRMESQPIRNRNTRRRRRTVSLTHRIIVRCIYIVGFLLAAALFLLIATKGIEWFVPLDSETHYIEKEPKTNTISTVSYETVPAGAQGVAADNIIDNRKILENAELESQLAELAAENIEIAQIYKDRASYPEELLAGLSENLEFVEFVQGYLTADGTVTGGISEEEKEEDFPLFLQWDSRWGYVSYGNSVLGVSGCGPACLSMVIYALTRDETVTPDNLADFSMDNGFYVQGIGTAWDLMTGTGMEYGVTGYEASLDEAVMKQYLDMGYPIICSMRSGDFTTTGHFIVIYGYDEKGFFVNDPNSRERSSRQWTFSKLQYQIKNLWYYRKG